MTENLLLKWGTMNLPPNVVKMICHAVNIHGDPFEPWESMTDYGRQEKEWKCHGCQAIGLSKWPEWKLEMAHEPDCAWVAWRDALGQAVRTTP